MLSEQEKTDIAGELRHYPDVQAVVPEALKIVQRARGWVSDEAVADVAALLGKTADEVDAIATFYSMIFRKPVGRHIILLCDSVSCWIMGFHAIHAHLSARLDITFGQTTSDGRFTLLPAACLGACDHAPVMMIDDDLHLDLTADKVDELLARYL